MKITFVLPELHTTGGNRVAAIYAEKLQARGHDVTILAPDFATPGGRPIFTADAPDADVIVATWWETAFWVAAMDPSKGAKAYFVQHHEVHEHLPWWLSRGSYHLPLRKITIAKWLVETMAEEYGDDDVDLVPNSVDTDQFHAPPREKQSAPTVGLLYSTTAFKGVDVSLEAIARLTAELPDLQVVAFGAKPVSKDLPLPPGARYFQAPAQDEIRDIYAACDVWLMASRSEGFGLTAFEAMACRCPVVSTAVGGPRDFVKDGVEGYLASVGDVDGLVAGLRNVLTRTPAQWREMSDAAFRCATSYSWDDAADLFEAALSRTAESRG